MMGITWNELKNLGDVELMQKYDKKAETVPDSLSTYQDELRHREMMTVLDEMRSALSGMELSIELIMKRYAQVSGIPKSK